MIHDFSDNSFTGSIPMLPLISKVGSITLQNREEDWLCISSSWKQDFGVLIHNKLSINYTDLNGFFLNVSNRIIFGEISPNVSVNWKCLKFLDASNNQVSCSCYELVLVIVCLCSVYRIPNKMIKRMLYVDTTVYTIKVYAFSVNCQRFWSGFLFCRIIVLSLII